MIRYLVTGFPGAFRECSDWLASWCAPWHWVTSFWSELGWLRTNALQGDTSPGTVE